MGSSNLTIRPSIRSALSMVEAEEIKLEQNRERNTKREFNLSRLIREETFPHRSSFCFSDRVAWVKVEGLWGVFSLFSYRSIRGYFLSRVSGRGHSRLSSSVSNSLRAIRLANVLAPCYFPSLSCSVSVAVFPVFLSLFLFSSPIPEKM